VSDPKKPGASGADPFQDLDWDKELDDWEHSTDEPSKVTVPESFSQPPPPATKKVDDLRSSSVPNSSKAPARPLYRPPNATAKPPIAPPPRPAIPRPAAGRPAAPPQKPPELASLIDDDLDAETVAPKESDMDMDEDESTVVAPVSRDLLAELEKAGFPRRNAPANPALAPQATPVPGSDRSNMIASTNPTASVHIDPGVDEEKAEPTQEHPAPEMPEVDHGVVTSAPSYQGRPRGGGRPVEAPRPPGSADHPVPEGAMYDPFKGLDVEPPASESVSHPPPPPSAPGPRLLAPERRKHSDTDETAILDKKAIERQAGVGNADSTLETADPFSATPDPFSATPDPFAPTRDVETTDEGAPPAPTSEPQEGALIDLLRAEETTGDGLPAAADLQETAAEIPAADYVIEQFELWRARYERIANEARTKEKQARARGLIVASEIAAIAGETAQAIALAEEAWEAAPADALAVRQLRQLLAAEGRWEDVAPLLEQEAKTGPPVARAHAAILAADAARLARAAPDEATRLYETAQRATPNDVRPTIARALAALSSQKTLPLLRWTQGVGLEPLTEAVHRRAKGGEPAEDTSLAATLDGIAAFPGGKGGVEGELATALDELSASPTLGPAARWVRIALDASRAKSRASALSRIADAPPGRGAIEARLAVALDVGDAAQAASAATSLAQQHGDATTQLASIGVQAISGTAAGADALVAYASEPGVGVVGRALAIQAGEDPPTAFAASDGLDAAMRVARRFVQGGAVDPDLRARTSAGAQKGFALADALGGGGPRATIMALTPLLVWPDDVATDELLAWLLVELAEADHERAKEMAKQAQSLDPDSHVAVRALLALGDPDASAAAISVAEGTADDARSSALAMHVALRSLRRNEIDLAKRATELALLRSPDDSTVAFVAELRARRGGDFDGVVEAVRARARSSNDPVAKTANLVREVFLLLGADLPTCIERASEAAQLMPKDPTIRALYERIAGEGAQGRAEWRADMAQSLEGAAKGETLLDAAREAERHGDGETAEKLAVAAEQAGIGAEATTLRHRVQSRGAGAARLAEELLEVAKTAPDAQSQRETYEQLADLDLYARADTASAILWHRAIVEATPGYLPSLRRLEHMLVGEGREDDYESIASELARTLPPDARDAHAEVAARLRLKHPEAQWMVIADLVQAATEREVPSYWATRMLDALARLRGDDKSLLRAVDLLLTRTDRPAEVAALATRGAEASFRLGDVERARGYLERALEADPQHPTALASMAELRRQSGDERGAAEAIEIMAQNQLVAEHRLEDWHAAAVIWLDRVNDAVRGRAALERASEIDLGYADVFDRLVALARDGKEHAILADLYARRLMQIDDVTAKSTLQVEYARVLVEMGDRDGARTALSDALAAAPGNPVALDEGARLAEEAEDWPDYESYLIRMAESAQDPDARDAIHRRLAALYEGPYPDDKKAEESYRKILEHKEDDDIFKRLVDVYVRLGDGEQAVETHKERVRLAPDPSVRRARLIELARLLDEVAQDPERALKALEQARAGDPADLDALAALAEFHTKHGRPELVASALEQASNDLRAKLAVDAGDVQKLEQLQKILELRGQDDARHAVHEVMLGLSGNPGELPGAEDAANLPGLDELLCPPELSPAIRALLVKAGDALEKSVPVDLRALKAAKLGASNPALKAKIDAVARGFGLPDPDVVISRAMPLLCLPVGAKPFQIVVGEAIVGTDDEVARRFVLYRAMKSCSTHCAALIRVPPADLKVFLDVLLHHLVPDHPAPEMEPERLDEISKRLQRFIPRKDEAELRTLAAQVVSGGVPSIDALASAAATWADRVALLAVADVGAALRGVAWTLGQKDSPPQGVQARREWLMQNPAARDLVVYALSDVYLEARRKAGVR
jgi:tetratricopeptide (TPR) repeat protein